MRIKAFSHSEGLPVNTTNPNSKGAFTPFIFGFLLFGLIQLNGAAMNPLRLLGPALISGFDHIWWSNTWVYILGELTGAACAGYLVHSIERLHKQDGNINRGSEDFGMNGKYSMVQSPLIE